MLNMEKSDFRVKESRKLCVLAYSLNILSGVILVIANVIESLYMGIASMLLLSTAIVLYCLYDFTKRIGFAVFMACMFTFQIGGVALPALIGDPEWKMGLSNFEYIVTCNCLYISCITLMLANTFWGKYTVLWKKENKASLRMLKDSSYNISAVQNWAFMLCIISSAIAILGEAQKMVHAIANGYMSMYGGYTSSALVIRMQLISRISMFIGLAARPSKKRAWIYFFLGLPVPLMTLIEGSRMGIMSYILFFIYYFYSFGDWSHIRVSAKKRRTKQRRLFAVALAIVFVAAPLLYVYGYSRVGLAAGSNNPFLYILRFFSSQGSSAKLIGWAERYKGMLPGTCYSLGAFIDRIQGNYFLEYSVESAINTNSFGRIMSYLSSPYNYTVLHFGVGSSYIAEVFYDFGYTGLIVVNFIIAYILNLLSAYGKIGTLTKSFAFMLFFYMMALPRSSLLTPLENVLSTSCLFAVLFIFTLSKRRKS